MTEPRRRGIQPELHINNDLRGGVWSNFAAVAHTPYEFTIDFARLDYAQNKDGKVPGVVVSRVNLSPLMVTELMQALQDNWAMYAEKSMPPELRDGPEDV